MSFMHVQMVFFPAQEQIPGIIRKPTTDEERRVNVDQVLQFMTQNRIKMHRISCKGYFYSHIVTLSFLHIL